jgi:hypothetical protein
MFPREPVCPIKIAENIQLCLFRDGGSDDYKFRFRIEVGRRVRTHHVKYTPTLSKHLTETSVKDARVVATIIQHP